MGEPMQEWRALPPWKYSDWMGWHEQGEGKWFYGFNIEQVCGLRLSYTSA